MKKINEFIKEKEFPNDVENMKFLISIAEQAKSNGDVPIAAMLVWSGGRRFVEHDTRYTGYNPLNHAIINLINKTAETLGPHKLREAILYSIVEPNVLCAMAIKDAGIKEVVFGAYDNKDGFMSSNILVDHTVLDISTIGGVLGEECCRCLPESMQEHVRYK